MNRFLITFIVGTFSTLSADYDPQSPTQLYQANFKRIQNKVSEINEKRTAVLGQLDLLKYSDHRDTRKPESDRLKVFQAQKELNRQKYVQELQQLKRELKKLSHEMKRLESTQAG